jgi:hypothetical protein
MTEDLRTEYCKAAPACGADRGQDGRPFASDLFCFCSFLPPPRGEVENCESDARHGHGHNEDRNDVESRRHCLPVRLRAPTLIFRMQAGAPR